MMQVANYDAYPSVRWSNIEAIFGIIDQTAIDMQKEVSSESPISSLDQIMNGTMEETYYISTLETSMLLLDGADIFPSNYNLGEVGWESYNISDDEGYINETFRLVDIVGKTHSSIGFTIDFSPKKGEFLRDFIIETYQNGNLISSDVVKDNLKTKYVSKIQAVDYDTVVIIAKRTSLPNRRARIVEIQAGISERFSRSNVISTKIKHELSPLTEALPSNELSITIDNSSKLYNLINPESIYRFLQDGQKIVVSYGTGAKPETIQMLPAGTFYFTSAKSSGATAEITAHDIMYKYDDIEFTKGSVSKRPLSEIIELIIEGEMEVDIPDNIANRMVSAGIYGVSKREALRMVIQACMATCFISVDNRLVVRDFIEKKTPDEELTRDKIYEDVDVEVTEKVDQIEIPLVDLKTVTDYSETVLLYYNELEMVRGEEKTLVCNYNELTDITSLDIDVLGAIVINSETAIDNATLTIMPLVENVIIKITGKKVFKTQSTYILGDSKSGEDTKIKKIMNDLISINDTDIFGQWLKLQIEKRLIYPIDARGNLAWELCDTIQVYDIFGENKLAVIYSLEWSFDKWWSCQVKARGEGGGNYVNVG